MWISWYLSACSPSSPLILCSRIKRQMVAHSAAPCWQCYCEDILLKGGQSRTNCSSPTLKKNNAYLFPLLLWLPFWSSFFFLVLHAFLTCLSQIGHCLQEYTSRFKVENSFSATNLSSQ